MPLHIDLKDLIDDKSIEVMIIIALDSYILTNVLL